MITHSLIDVCGGKGNENTARPAGTREVDPAGARYKNREALRK